MQPDGCDRVDNVDVPLLPLDGVRSSPSREERPLCPSVGHIPGVNANGELFPLSCKRYGCLVCGPKRAAYVQLTATRRVLDALESGCYVYALGLTGGSAGLWLSEVSAGWTKLARRLRVFEHTGYVRVIHLDPHRVGAHAHAIFALPTRLGTRRRDLRAVAIRAGFGSSWYVSTITGTRQAERASRYLAHQLIRDGRALAGTGASLVSWSRAWRPDGWVDI